MGQRPVCHVTTTSISYVRIFCWLAILIYDILGSREEANPPLDFWDSSSSPIPTNPEHASVGILSNIPDFHVLFVGELQ